MFLFLFFFVDCAGYDVNKKNKHGKTPLYYAKLHSHEELIKLLESHGATVGMVGTYRTIINRINKCSVVNPDTKD